jgi:type I restriction enzyme, R subunit
MKNEAQTRHDFIDPALHSSGWKDNIKVEYNITDGRLIGGGKRGEKLKADYLLHYKNENLAIIEAKRENLPPTSGLEQAKKYGEMLKLQFVYATNGKEIYEFDMLHGKGQYITQYPSPNDLYNRIHQSKGSLREHIINQPYSDDGKHPRYYQEIAINKAIEAICKGDDRILLTLATGTGKTVIAFQLAYKLYQAKWNINGTNRRPKILFLADRNVLADQAMNTFNSLEKDLIKINGEEIKKRHGKVPTHCSLYFAIYQAIADRKTENPKNTEQEEKESIGGYYQAYDEDFFDLVIIDECHRGSAKEEGSWRKILDYFKGAVHLGLTATPKRDDNVDTYDYFGKPVYEYSLKEGIQDGFLSPYKVKRFKTSLDEYSYQIGDSVVHGEVDPNKLYNRKNYNRDIILYEHIDLIAKTIIEQINTFDKTIVFCADQEHAANMRDAINNFKEVKDKNYCVRVTSDDGKDGRTHLEHFQDNDKNIPTILTSSQMLTTGIDARNVRNIVLAREIKSMVEFKQIIGRGTRLYDNKDYFTILDFTDSCELFKDDAWDGLPDDQEETTITVPTGGKGVKEPRGKGEDEIIIGGDNGGETPEPKQKAKVRLSNNRILEITETHILYIDEEGRTLTAEQFLKRIVGILPELYQDEQQLRTMWSNPETRKQAFDYLQNKNISQEHLESLQQIINAKDCDIFDVLSHITHNTSLTTRTKRAATVRANQQFFEVYKNLQAQEFLKFLLERYEKDGIKELDRANLSELIKLKRMDTSEVIAMFGGSDKLIEAFIKLQEELFKAS